VHGDGLDSDPITIIAATIPTQMAAPEVTLNGVDVIYRVSFTVPFSGGVDVEITAYQIELITASGDWQVPSTCISD
jgi:hypothetical protein